MTLLILLFICYFLAIHAAPANVTDLNKCSDEGEEVKLLTGWFICHNGRYVPSACQADNGTRVDIGLTIRQRNFVYECTQTSDSPDGTLALRPVACLRQKDKPENAILVEPGQTVRDPPFVYECTRLPSPNPNVQALSLKAVACANKTSEIPDGGTVVLDDKVTFTCERQSGSLTDYKKEVFLKAKGCIYKGKEYEINSQTIIGDFVYRCVVSPLPASQMEFTIVGCASEGHRYDPDEKFHTPRTNFSNGRFIMQCRNTNGTWSIKPVGCVEETNPAVDHAIGDTWIDNGGPGDNRLKYIVVCRGDAAKVAQVPIQCVYQPNPNDLSTAKTLDPGCMRRFTKPNVLVKCAKGANENDGVSSELITKLNLNKFEQEALAEGFRHC